MDDDQSALFALRPDSALADGASSTPLHGNAGPMLVLPLVV